MRIYSLGVEGDSPPGQKPVFSCFTYKLKKIIKNQEINEIKMLKRQYFQKNKLYKMAIFNIFLNN